MSEITNPISHLGKVTIVSLDVCYTPGFKKIPRKDLESKYGTLPPEEYITQGQGRLYPRSAIKVFDTLRAQARRICLDVGVSFMGGYAIPDDKRAGVIAALNEVQKKYLEAKTAFIADARNKSAEWIQGAPSEWQDVLSRVTYSSEELDRKIGFNFVVFRIDAVQPADDSEGDVTSGLENQTRGMADQLLYEISLDANDAWRETLKDKTACRQSTADRVRKLCGKLHDLAWLSPKAKNLSDYVRQVLDSLPDQGMIDGKDFVAFRGLVLLLADPKKVDEAADAMKTKQMMSGFAIGAPIKKPKPSPEECTTAAPQPAASSFPSTKWF